MERCTCGKIGSSECKFKSCKKCCIGKNYCTKHNTNSNLKNDLKNNLSSRVCFICLSDVENLNKFDELEFCNKCYELNKKIFDKKSIKEKIIFFDDICKIQKFESEDKNNEFKKFLNYTKKYNNTIVTEKILEDEIKLCKYFSYDFLYYCNIKYECPDCKKIIKIEDSIDCKKCGVNSCYDGCTQFLHIYYKNTNHCYKSNFYCENCFSNDANIQLYNECSSSHVTNNDLKNYSIIVSLL